MNYLELLLHPGSLDSSSLEKTADCLLAFPRCLWLSREVTVLPHGAITYETPGLGDPFNCFCKDSIPCNPNPGALLIFTLNLVLVDLPAGMLACFGMPIKHMELITNEKAASYSRLVECLLLKERYEEKKLRLQEKLNEYPDNFQNVLDEGTYKNQKKIQWQIKINDLENKIRECDAFMERENL